MSYTTLRRIGAGLVVTIATALPAGAETLVVLDNPDARGLQAEAFELRRTTTVRLEAVGLRNRDRDGGFNLLNPWRNREDDAFSVDAWLLDAETRKPVWRMSPANATNLSGDLRGAEESLRLEPGRYEVYLYSGLELHDSEALEGERRSLWDRFWSSRNRDDDDLREDLAQCHVTLTAHGLTRDDIRPIEPGGDWSGAVVRHSGVGDSRFLTGGFALSEDATVRVYSLIEHRDQDRSPSDYGWIVDFDTREIVWSPVKRDYEPGGGGKKTRAIDVEVPLPAGRYAVHYGTDDSHSAEGFNTGAPHDPLNWGITVLRAAGSSVDAFTDFTPQPAAPLIDLTGLGDERFESRAFRVHSRARLHVQALGEQVDGRQFSDHGWILDAGSGDTVWSMTVENTIGAGGSDKNRAFDGLIELEAGDYVLHYVTDGSHAVESWNGATPFEPDAWGVRLLPAPGMSPDHVELLDESELRQDPSTLVRLARAGDDVRLQGEFTLEDAGRVEIYALGEGQNGKMYDFGSIREARSGRLIWEMSYDETDHAGGAEKNRVVRSQIELPPGTYRAVYVTDDSHSFQEWNGPRPRDFLSWGITVRLVR